MELSMIISYHATKIPSSIEIIRVHLELTMIKSPHGHFNIVMVGSKASVFYSATGRKG